MNEPLSMRFIYEDKFLGKVEVTEHRQSLNTTPRIRINKMPMKRRKRRSKKYDLNKKFVRLSGSRRAMLMCVR